MDLLCCENATVDLDMKCKSYLDPVLLRDDRVLLNLLNLEEKYMPNSSYFSCVQTDVEPRMRDTVAHWMLEVSTYCTSHPPNTTTTTTTYYYHHHQFYRFYYHVSLPHHCL